MSVSGQSDAKLRQNLEEVIAALRKHNTSLEAELEKSSGEVVEYKTRIVLVCHTLLRYVFKPPPLVGAGGGYMFSGRPSMPLSVRPSVIHVVVFMFPRYLQYLLTVFRQTFVTGASRDRDELIRFWGQKVKSSRSHHCGGGAQHSKLPSSATFSSCWWKCFIMRA